MDRAPTFLLEADVDQGQLERLKVVKVWMTKEGGTRDRVYDVGSTVSAPVSESAGDCTPPIEWPRHVWSNGLTLTSTRRTVPEPTHMFLTCQHVDGVHRSVSQTPSVTVHRSAKQTVQTSVFKNAPGPPPSGLFQWIDSRPGAGMILEI